MANQVIDPLWKDTCIKELTPGIQTNKEKQSFKSLDSHKSQLKNEELWFRVQER
ncbi:MAG: hypothetical protein Q8936_14085 [Bacillota bacterium]|nr:hypothetical protein [Bacillota bacterium]